MATRKDYVMIADCINLVLIDSKTLYDEGDSTTFIINNFTRNLVQCLCSKYYEDNKNFDEDKFKDAVYKNVTDVFTSGGQHG